MHWVAEAAHDWQLTLQGWQAPPDAKEPAGQAPTQAPLLRLGVADPVWHEMQALLPLPTQVLQVLSHGWHAVPSE